MGTGPSFKTISVGALDAGGSLRTCRCLEDGFSVFESGFGDVSWFDSAAVRPLVIIVETRWLLNTARFLKAFTS